MKNLLLLAISLSFFFTTSCKSKKDDIISPTPTPPKLIFKFKFDSTQARLDNFGNPEAVGGGNAAQSPVFKKMGAHYVELTPTANTLLGDGAVLYKAPETSIGGSAAIDFDQSTIVGEGEEFFSIPLKDITVGTYKYIRVSLSYQNYDIKYKYNYLATDYTATGRLASFIGFKTYVTDYTINTLGETINANKSQGYWGFESLGNVYNGQAAGTTVPNPLSATSPIPAGSCVVTGQFATDFVVTGNETEDIVITISLSTNKSFEWTEVNSDGWYQPDAGETVTDMGIRGLVPIVQ